jgi:ADP-ribosylglycohydrolase
MPVETMTPNDILKATDGNGVTGYLAPIQTRLAGTKNLPAGSITDDGQLSLASARSIIRVGDFSVNNQALELVREFESCAFGWGRATAEGAKELQAWFGSNGKDGRNPTCPAPAPTKPGEGCGNGVAMKIGPLSIFRTIQFGLMVEPFMSEAMQFGLLTHGDPRASFAAIAIGTVIGTMLYADPCFSSRNMQKIGPIDPSDIKNQLFYQRVKDAEARYQYFRPDPDTLSGRLENMWQNTHTADALRIAAGTGCFALESVPFAIGTFFRHPTNFREGVLEAVNAGGDTDTNASMVGAMIGANCGLVAIPMEMQRGLAPHVLDDAIDCADKLFETILNS